MIAQDRAPARVLKTRGHPCINTPRSPFPRQQAPPLSCGVAEPGGGLFFSGQHVATALLIDGDFFLKRYRQLRGRLNPERVAKDLHGMCLAHLDQRDARRYLYRISSRLTWHKVLL